MISRDRDCARTEPCASTRRRSARASTFGEWWGKGVQRGYGLETKAFSLFNVKRWRDLDLVIGGVPVRSVPVLDEMDLFDTERINGIIGNLWQHGSFAAPGFKQPEGLVVQHVPTRTLFKVTLEKDESPKGAES